MNTAFSIAVLRARSLTRLFTRTALVSALAAALGGVSVSAQEFIAPLKLHERLTDTEQRLDRLEAIRLPAVPDAEVEALQRRLQETESRLKELEAQRLPSPGAAEADLQSSLDADTAKMLADMQKQIENLEEAVEEQEKASKFFATSGTSNSTVEIFGRIHTDLWTFPDTSPGANAMETGSFTDTPQDRIGFRRLRAGVAGEVGDLMLYKIELEFASGNDIEFRDAFIGFDELGPFDTVLIGNQKRPYGLDHINSSRYNVFLERPFVVEAFNQDSRRLGVCSYGFSEDLRYNWRYGAFNGRLIQDEGWYVSDHFQGELAGRFCTTAWYDEASEGRGYWHLGVSGTVAHPDGLQLTDDLSAISEGRFRTRPEARTDRRWIDTGVIAGGNWYELANFETVLNLGPLQICGEYMNGFMQREAGYGGDLYFNGGYVYAAYFLTGEYMPWDRESGQLARPKPYENFWLVDTCRDGTQAGWGAWQIACRGSYGDFSDQDILGGVGRSVTFGLNWYWNPNARLQFNYLYGEIEDRELTVNNVAQVVSGNYSIIGARVCIDF